jgi:hypothetical protein
LFLAVANAETKTVLMAERKRSKQNSNAPCFPFSVCCCLSFKSSNYAETRAKVKRTNSFALREHRSFTKVSQHFSLLLLHFWLGKKKTEAKSVVGSPIELNTRDAVGNFF